MPQEGFNPFKKYLPKNPTFFFLCARHDLRDGDKMACPNTLILGLCSYSLVEETDTNHMIIQINVKLKF